MRTSRGRGVRASPPTGPPCCGLLPGKDVMDFLWCPQEPVRETHKNSQRWRDQVVRGLTRQRIKP